MAQRAFQVRAARQRGSLQDLDDQGPGRRKPDASDAAQAADGARVRKSTRLPGLDRLCHRRQPSRSVQADRQRSTCASRRCDRQVDRQCKDERRRPRLKPALSRKHNVTLIVCFECLRFCVPRTFREGWAYITNVFHERDRLRAPGGRELRRRRGRRALSFRRRWWGPKPRRQ